MRGRRNGKWEAERMHVEMERRRERARDVGGDGEGIHQRGVGGGPRRCCSVRSSPRRPKPVGEKLARIRLASGSLGIEVACRERKS
eukprot:2184882-Rhodomonas_salina.2